MTQRRQTALITGASSGIGMEFARLLAAGKIDIDEKGSSIGLF